MTRGQDFAREAMTSPKSPDSWSVGAVHKVARLMATARHRLQTCVTYRQGQPVQHIIQKQQMEECYLYPPKIVKPHKTVIDTSAVRTGGTELVCCRGINLH